MTQFLFPLMGHSNRQLLLRSDQASENGGDGSFRLQTQVDDSLPRSMGGGKCILIHILLFNLIIINCFYSTSGDLPSWNRFATVRGLTW